MIEVHSQKKVYEVSMEVRLRKMNVKEFKSYCEYSVNDYAKDLMKSSDITLEEAREQARKEFKGMLPQGTDTKDNYVMIIEDVRDRKAVGIIWYLYEEFQGAKQVFLSDFIVYEEERRKGYATVALAEMERNAMRDGCKQSIIYVWKHNPPGINLYTKCGYITFKELNDGMYMKKSLGAGN